MVNRPLFNAQVRLLDDLTPAGDILLDELGVLFGGHRNRLESGGLHLLLGVGIGRDLYPFHVRSVDDVARGPRGREIELPGIGLRVRDQLLEVFYRKRRLFVLDPVLYTRGLGHERQIAKLLVRTIRDGVLLSGWDIQHVPGFDRDLSALDDLQALAAQDHDNVFPFFVVVVVPALAAGDDQSEDPVKPLGVQLLEDVFLVGLARRRVLHFCELFTPEYLHGLYLLCRVTDMGPTENGREPIRSSLARLPLSHQDGAAQGKDGLVQKAKPDLPADRERPFKTSERHVDFWLDEPKPALLLQESEDLVEEAGFVRHLVDHPEDEGEVGRPLDAQALLLTAVRDDPVGHPRLRGAPHESVEHPLLEIDRNDFAAGTGQPRHGDREVPHPAADIDRGYSGSQVGGKEGLRVVKKAAQGIIEAVAEPPGTNMHFSTAVHRARLCSSSFNRELFR